MLTRKLSHLGMDVALIEKGDKLASGPSTRNEGWLHRGTYHAVSIKDRDSAMQVAQRCIYGHEQIRKYAPEAIEESDVASYALVGQEKDVDDVVSRWDEAGVEYTPVTKKELARKAPEVQVGNIQEAFKVGDVAVNTRLLYRKLLYDAESAGAKVLPNSGVIFDRGDSLKGRIISSSGEENVTVNPSIVIHANGYGMRNEFVDQFDIDIPMRYWKSHLFIADRLSHHSVFYLDAGEAAMINHAGHSIIGLNEDAVVVEEPDYETIPTNVNNLEQAIKRLFKLEGNVMKQATACVKVDLAENTFARRSLNLALFEPKDGHLCVLPGKMTEAPYTTDVLTRIIYDRLSGEDQIALRPIDRLR